MTRLSLFSILFFISTTLYAAPVKRPYHGFYASGTLIGKPLKVSKSGLMFKTWEVDIQMGEFADASKYLSTPWSMSIEEDRMDLVEKFNKLDKTKNYLFVYKYPHP